MVIVVMGYGENMNKFYRKAKPETMKLNRDANKNLYSKEIQWLKDNLSSIKNNKFLMDMYQILITGSRRMSDKMIESVRNAMNNDPRYNEDKRKEKMEKLTPIVAKINVVLAMAEAKNDKAVDFIKKVKQYVRENLRITTKQMTALNKVFKRVSEDLFEDTEKNEKKA